MALAYTEGKSLVRDLYTDLRTAILASSDWARLTSDATILTTTANANAGATTLTFTSGAPAAAGVVVGSTLKIDTGATQEWRTVTAVAATTVTVAALSYAHASGTIVSFGDETFRAVTTRGAEMIIDLADAHHQPHYMQVAFYRNYSGGALSGKQTGARYLTWKGQAGGTQLTNYVYWTVSADKDHLFIMVEGPKAGEANADNGNYGSVRNYLFMADLVPYFNSVLDPNPAVVAFASFTTAYKGGGPGLGDHKAMVSRDLRGEAWMPGSLLSLEPPGNTGGPYTPNRKGLDGNLMLAPYVYCDDNDGFRGRLSNLFFAGPNLNHGDWLNTPPAVGSYLTYDGIKYRLLVGNKGNNSSNGHSYGPLGMYYNTGGSPGYLSGPVIAVPHSAA